MTGQAERWHVERLEHPVVPLLITLDARDCLVAVAFGEDEEVARAHAMKHGAHLQWRSVRTPSGARQQLVEYLAGHRRHFALATRPIGTTFQRLAWEALTRIPFGKTISYGEHAARLGNAAAVRAVGRANGSNPIPIVFPCHRVIGSDGSLTGFGGGLARKRWLLEHEASQLTLAF